MKKIKKPISILNFMKKIKKPISILLVFMMIVSLFAVVPISASAATKTTAEALAIPRNRNVNLATLTGNITLLDGDIVTGTLQGDYKISIADGATVTLKDVDITCLTGNANFAAITPLGDATILLEGENTVKGGYKEYPGIFVPEGKTLTIDGTGSLDASSNGYGCGIGGGCEMAVGNITITGGTITANGGYGAAGIGSGYDSACGDITIAGTVTQVTATKGESAKAGIGAGEDVFSGTVIIEDGANVTQN